MADPDFAPALDLGVLGFARAGADLVLRAREGQLMRWLPPPGASLVDSAVFFGMEEELAGLRAGHKARIDLPGLRLPPSEDAPFALTVVFDADAAEFLIYASADCGALDFERQLAHERRQTQILVDQAKALADQAKAAGRGLREQAALYRDIVESASDLVLRLGPDLRVSSVNQVACRLLGLTEAQILGRAVDAVLASPPEAPWTARFAHDRQELDESFEQPLRPTEGATVWIWWSVHWICGDGSGEFQALGRDMTDLRRLRVESSARADEARANAVMRERLRIAHDLHDTLVHSLVALAPQIRLIRKVAGADAPARVVEELRLAEQAVRAGLARARAAIGDLRRQPIESAGLGAALEALALRFAARTGIHILVDLDPRAENLGPDAPAAFYRIVEEALRNAELHAQPTRVDIVFAADDAAGVTLVIADDGCGFDPRRIPEGHFGLIGMRERAELIGAALTLDSAPGDGTRILVVAPHARLD
jgi:PAS domain S-box-containing protein